MAVVFLDLDGFKSVNDTFGHAAGDHLLAAIADRLREAVRPSDTVARLGGDEFVVVCEDVVDAAHARSLAARLQGTLARPFTLDHNELSVGASVGIALASSPQPAEAVLEEADSAMYRAKRRTRSPLVVSELAAGQARGREELERALRRALDTEDLLVHYQPIIDLRTGGIVGVEALVRWRHPDGNVVPSANFISLAEDRGLVGALDEWVLDHALADVRDWLDTLGQGRRLELSVNLSVRDLARTGLTHRLEELLRRHRWADEALSVELTERRLHQSAASTLDTLDALHALGVRVAVDDFGTGRLSLGELYRLPLDSVKVDRAFVARVDVTGDSQLLAAMLAVADALGLATVSEGVETAGQLGALRERGCDRAQGYLFSPPAPAATILSLLQADPRW